MNHCNPIKWDYRYFRLLVQSILDMTIGLDIPALNDIAIILKNSGIQKTPEHRDTYSETCRDNYDDIAEYLFAASTYDDGIKILTNIERYYGERVIATSENSHVGILERKRLAAITRLTNAVKDRFATETLAASDGASSGYSRVFDQQPMYMCRKRQLSEDISDDMAQLAKRHQI